MKKSHTCLVHLTIYTRVNNGPPSAPLYVAVRDLDTLTIMQPIEVTFGVDGAPRVEDLTPTPSRTNAKPG
jgi:hypothetical protein